MYTSREMLEVDKRIRRAQRNNIPPLQTHECSCKVQVYTFMRNYHERTEMHKKRLQELEVGKKLLVEEAYKELFALATPFRVKRQDFYSQNGAELFDFQMYHNDIPRISICDF